jgi:exodeoxyribonuclease V alpha subunit
LLALAAYAGRVLTRELLYTGITRARSAFSLAAANGGLLQAAIQRKTRRESGLRDALDQSGRRVLA